MIRAGKVVVILFVIKGPILGVGHGGGRPHLLGHRLGVIEHLNLHGLVVALFAAVIGAIVILVPMLIARTAGKGGIVGKGHNRPVFADKLVAGRDQPRRVEQIKHRGHVGRCHADTCIVDRLFLPVDLVMNLGRDAQAFGGQDDQPATGKVEHQSIRCGVG